MRGIMCVVIAVSIFLAGPALGVRNQIRAGKA